MMHPFFNQVKVGKVGDWLKVKVATGLGLSWMMAHPGRGTLPYLRKWATKVVGAIAGYRQQCHQYVPGQHLF